MKSLFWTLPLAIILSSGPLAGSILFSENFEGTFTAPHWIGNNSGSVVTDPLNGANNALHFNSYGSGGDLFSQSLVYPIGTLVNVEFDFLNTNTSAENTGGYVGTNHGCCFFNDEDWRFPNLTATPNVWTHFSAQFFVVDSFSAGEFNLKLEQNQVSDAPPVGTIYFDNILVETVPEPASLGLMGLGLAGLLWARAGFRRPNRFMRNEAN